ncbi:MAG: hypothetical protein NNA31_01720 [Nitrospira sp.]|nr:hypothetical protein [Nitrospira sp.]
MRQRLTQLMLGVCVLLRLGAGSVSSLDNLSPSTSFVNPITTHADYRLTLRSDDFQFLVSGNTITITPVPLPAAVWLFGSGLAAACALVRKQMG